MASHEFYFMLLVIGAFGGFALAMVVATLQYKGWQKHRH
jgi:hypothetical protein